MNRIVLIIFTLLMLAEPAAAQRSERFGPYELFYSVVNTTFLTPQVASSYGITRGNKRAIINYALREHLPDGSTEARSMKMIGRSWDLIANKDLEFNEIHETNAIYYIAEFAFINREWHFFELQFLPEGAEDSYTFKFKQQLYINP